MRKFIHMNLFSNVCYRLDKKKRNVKIVKNWLITSIELTKWVILCLYFPICHQPKIMVYQMNLISPIISPGTCKKKLKPTTKIIFFHIIYFTYTSYPNITDTNVLYLILHILIQTFYQVILFRLKLDEDWVGYIYL